MNYFNNLLRTFINTHNQQNNLPQQNNINNQNNNQSQPNINNQLQQECINCFKNINEKLEILKNRDKHFINSQYFNNIYNNLRIMETSIDHNIRLASVLYHLQITLNDLTILTETIKITDKQSNGSLKNLIDSEFTILEADIVNIKYLIINNCQITDIDILFPNLEKMDLSNNKITQMKNIPDKLRELNLSNNEISKIENLPTQSIELVLKLSNNKIAKLENLNVQNLIEIYIKNNLIEYVENLPTSLFEINLKGNNIKEIRQINFSLISIKYDSTYIQQMKVSDILEKCYNDLIQENFDLKEVLLHPDSPLIAELAKLYHETGSFRKNMELK